MVILEFAFALAKLESNGFCGNANLAIMMGRNSFIIDVKQNPCFFIKNGSSFNYQRLMYRF